MNKRGLSPLIATILLVIFALIIGTATMTWGKNYVGEVPEEQSSRIGSSYVISKNEVNSDPLKKLQISYIYDQITLEEYLRQEKEIISKKYS